MTEADAGRVLADAHIHLFAHGFAGTDGRTPAGDDELAVYEAQRSIHGIAASLVVAYEGDERYRGNNHHVAALAADRAWIEPVAHLPTWPPPHPDALEHLRSQGFVGVALWVPAAEDASALASWPREVVAAVGSGFRVVSLNAPVVHAHALAGFVADAAPAAVLFSHVGLPGRQVGPPPGLQRAREILAPLLRLAALEHVGVKASGYYAVSDPPHAHPHAAAHPFVEAVVDAFGPGRVYWGSDFAPALGHVSFAQTVDAWLPPCLSPDEVDAVMGRNLLRLLGSSG